MRLTDDDRDHNFVVGVVVVVALSVGRLERAVDSTPGLSLKERVWHQARTEPPGQWWNASESSLYVAEYFLENELSWRP